MRGFLGPMSAPDRIILEGMVFFGRHGARKEEQALGQHFEVDLEIEADLSTPRASDHLRDTINYGDVYATVKAVVEGPSMRLLERVADEIATRVMVEFSPLAVRVRVKKPRLPLRGGVVSSVGVEVYRRASEG